MKTSMHHHSEQSNLLQIFMLFSVTSRAWFNFQN